MPGFAHLTGVLTYEQKQFQKSQHHSGRIHVCRPDCRDDHPLITRNQTTTTQTVDPTTVPTPTYPPVIADYSGISFDKVYLHPTGMYTIPEPTGWEVSSPSSNAGIAQVNMINQTQLSVIDAYVQDAEGPITPQDLDARFTQETILATWSNFRDPIETNRSFENDILTIDFRVGLANGQTYVARQNVWTDGEWIYVVRVVVPENATETLRFLLSNLTGKITPFKQFAAEPFNWNAYYDNVTSAIIRYPQAWTVTDSAPGRPASITGTNGEALRVEARAGQSVADEAAASAWLEAERPGATVLSVAPVTRGDVSGFSVAYTYNDVEGAAFSGLAVLLNGANALYIANLHFSGADIDLNTVRCRRRNRLPKRPNCPVCWLKRPRRRPESNAGAGDGLVPNSACAQPVGELAAARHADRHADACADHRNDGGSHRRSNGRRPGRNHARKRPPAAKVVFQTNPLFAIKEGVGFSHAFQTPYPSYNSNRWRCSRLLVRRGCGQILPGLNGLRVYAAFSEDWFSCRSRPTQAVLAGWAGCGNTVFCPLWLSDYLHLAQ
ncbi:MAG: hypothetical protein IPK17_11750 [Chloroflexi bacterium]|uniref:hypothetical protein n=1 Tax=Candidatus Flexifilum breve TaxID=3140694 RepID=UPI0031376087|nr:hypothetical protein [Chloroflexota bacterium]